MDEKVYKILDMDGVVYHLKISISMNPPADKKNPGCFHIVLYDAHMLEIEYAELDFTDENQTLDNITDSQVLDCIDILKKHIITVEKIDETRVLRFSSTRKEYRKIIRVAYSNEKEMEEGIKSIQKQLESDEQYKNGNISICSSMGTVTGLTITKGPDCCWNDDVCDQYEFSVSILIAIECPYDPKISI